MQHKVALDSAWLTIQDEACHWPDCYSHCKYSSLHSAPPPKKRQEKLKSSLNSCTCKSSGEWQSYAHVQGKKPH